MEKEVNEILTWVNMVFVYVATFKLSYKIKKYVYVSVQ